MATKKVKAQPVAQTTAAPKPEPTPEQREAWATYLQARYDHAKAYAAADDMAEWSVTHRDVIGARP